jgi:DNA polymerase-3 subunit epsilon
MSPLRAPLAFVDVETTGGGRDDRVLEIGVLRVEGGRVVDRFETLLDPFGYVPAMITELTGITNDDIEQAPQFEAVAEQLASVLDGAILVAHNAPFDYGFIEREFKRNHDPFARPYLCTVQLSRRLFPRYPKHDLDSLIDRHELDVPRRHRAIDDADAIWQFWQLLLYEFDLDVVERAANLQLRRQRALH